MQILRRDFLHLKADTVLFAEISATLFPQPLLPPYHQTFAILQSFVWDYVFQSFSWLVFVQGDCDSGRLTFESRWTFDPVSVSFSDRPKKYDTKWTPKVTYLGLFGQGNTENNT